jgi:acetyl coenzyme A synthetase (ADP forming)-like protein
MSLHAVFSPKSVAIIGASSQPGSVGNDLVKNLVESFRGNIYPINPKGGSLFNLPVYENISAVPGSVDLAIIAVPAAIVPQVLTEAGKKKVKAAVVISAGFKEVGQTELEDQIVAIAQKYNITLVGPNCLGVMNANLGFNGSFAPQLPPAGSVAFLSQSGALGTAIIDYAIQQQIGFSKFLSLGNKATLKETELLEYLAHDPDTKVILLYVEALRDLTEILAVAQKIRRVRHPKPIIVLKSKQTEAGAAAAQSHTGSLAGNDAFYEALFHQAGIIRAQTIEEFFLYAECFAFNPVLPKDRVAIVTNAGGVGVLVTDALVHEGLSVAKLSQETVEALQKVLPPAANIHNPIDILGDAKAQRYDDTLKIVSTDEGVDALVLLLTPQSMTEVEATAKVIVTAKRATKKPIVVSFIGGDRVQPGIQILQTGKITTTDFPESLVHGLGILHTFSIWKRSGEKPVSFQDVDTTAISSLIKNAHLNSEGWLPDDVALSILEAAGLPVIKWMKITAPDQIPKAVKLCGDRLVLKILSPDIVHKSDVGGVMVDVAAADAESAYHKLLAQVKKHQPEAHIAGVVVMPFVTLSGKELITGAVRDPNLGALVGIGMGGVFTEVFKDAAFGLAPLTPDDITDMIDRLKFSQILKGARGQTPFDLKVVKECIARVSDLFTKHPEIAELDVNPIMVFHKGSGAQIVDARMRVFR